jgi:hypothetical protein
MGPRDNETLTRVSPGRFFQQCACIRGGLLASQRASGTASMNTFTWSGLPPGVAGFTVSRGSPRTNAWPLPEIHRSYKPHKSNRVDESQPARTLPVQISRRLTPETVTMPPAIHNGACARRRSSSACSSVIWAWSIESQPGAYIFSKTSP